MQRKIIISLLVLILIILVGKCYFDSKENIAIPEKEQASIQKLEEGIYLIDKNWNPMQKDSVLNSDSSIKVVDPDIHQLLFITSHQDSITFNIDQINTQSPLILFDGHSSPFLCHLNSYENAKSFIFPAELKDIEKMPPLKQEQASISDIKQSNTESQSPREELDEAPILEIKSLDSIHYYRKRKALQSKLTIELADRSLFYPIINYNQYLSIRFDNDFWDYTDYYYTNGIGIGYSHPVFSSSPLSYLLVSNGNSGIDYYGLQMSQHMYTGSQPKVDTIIPGDRPWAAYTLLGQFLRSFDSKNKLVHYSEINLGVLGPQSGGGFIQDLVHTLLPNNSPPEGWHNQIATDYIIDYQYNIQKLLWESRMTESYMTLGAEVGTLRDNIKWGFGGRIGKFIPFYQDISIYRRNRIPSPFKHQLRFSVIGDVQTQLIGYDATLQGGVFNKSSVYVIPASDINRFVIEGYLGASLSYGRFELNFIQYWKSKEFKTGKDHKYVSVRLNVAF